MLPSVILQNQFYVSVLYNCKSHDDYLCDNLLLKHDLNFTVNNDFNFN